MNYNQLVLAGLIQPLELFNENAYSSNNLYKEVSALTEEAQKKLQLGLQWLQGHNLKDEFVVFGGMAVVHYVPGGRPLTPDLDLVCHDLQRIIGLLEQEKVQFTALALSDAILPATGISIPVFDTDMLVLKNRQLNDYIMQTAQPGAIAGAVMRFIDPSILMCLKSKSGRPKDLDDAIKLWSVVKDKKKVIQVGKNLIRKGALTQEDLSDLQSFMY